MKTRTTKPIIVGCVTLFAVLLAKGEYQKTARILFEPPVEIKIIDSNIRAEFEAVEQTENGVLIGFNVRVEEFRLSLINKFFLSDFFLFLPICTSINQELNSDVSIMVSHDCDNAEMVKVKVAGPGLSITTDIKPRSEDVNNEAMEDLGLSILVGDDEDWNELLIAIPFAYEGMVATFGSDNAAECEELDYVKSEGKELVLNFNEKMIFIGLDSEYAENCLGTTIHFKLLEITNEQAVLLVGGKGLRVPL